MSAGSSVLYRLGQLRSSLLDTLTDVDRDWVDTVLAPRERVLFYRMPRFDQTHSIHVARELEASGGGSTLLRAALLHDVGKTTARHGVPLIFRGAVVLVKAVSPRLLGWLARPCFPFWPFYLHVHHPRVGAVELARADAPRRVVELVRLHQEPSSDPELNQLQAADARH